MGNTFTCTLSLWADCFLPGGPPPSTMSGTDYKASASDDQVLRKPPRTPLEPEEMKRVFGYLRDHFERFHMGEVIGTGSYGIVRRCTEIKTGKDYAIKTLPKIPKKGPPTPRYLLKLRNEVDVMRQVGNSLNAVHLQGAYEDDDSIHLVMELCTGGPLLDWLVSQKRSEKDVAQIVRAILQFISQCHAKSIAHLRRQILVCRFDTGLTIHPCVQEPERRRTWHQN